MFDPHLLLSYKLSARFTESTTKLLHLLLLPVIIVIWGGFPVCRLWQTYSAKIGRLQSQPKRGLQQFLQKTVNDNWTGAIELVSRLDK